MMLNLSSVLSVGVTLIYVLPSLREKNLPLSDGAQMLLYSPLLPSCDSHTNMLKEKLVKASHYTHLLILQILHVLLVMARSETLPGDERKEPQ